MERQIEGRASEADGYLGDRWRFDTIDSVHALYVLYRMSEKMTARKLML